MDGTNYFDLNNWVDEIGSGGSWENWTVDNGVLNVTAADASDCNLANPDFNAKQVEIAPNPFNDRLNFSGVENGKISIYNALGKMIYSGLASGFLNTSEFPSGIYVVKIETPKQTVIRKLIKN